MLGSFDEVDDQELFLASGGASAAGLLKAAKAFKRIGGEALGPALDAYMIYDSIQDRKEILHDTEIISANTQVYQKDSVQYQNLQNQYDQKIDEAVSLDKMILDVKNDIGKDNWPAFVDFVNNGQW